MPQFTTAWIVVLDVHGFLKRGEDQIIVVVATKKEQKNVFKN